MRKHLKLIAITIILFAALPSISITEDTNEGVVTIIPNHVVLTNGIYIVSAFLSGDGKQGDTIVIELYSDEKKHREMILQDFDSELEITFSDISLSDYVKITWKDRENNIRCEPIIVTFRIIHALDWMALAELTSNISNAYRASCIM